MPFLLDQRFRMITHPERRGWAGNLNRTIEGRRGEFFVYQQQDDPISPTYIADLVAAAERFGNAVLLFSEMRIEALGTDPVVVRHKPLLGGPLGRVLTHLERLDTSMFRGLIRSSALDKALLRISEFENFSAEHPFMAELALQGEFRFVEGPTYVKRLHGGNTHVRWYDWGEDRKRGAWISLAAWMIEAIVPAGGSVCARWALFYAVFERFLISRGGDRWTFCHVDDDDSAARDALQLAIFDRLRTNKFFDPALLEASWPDVVQRTVEFFA